MQINLDIHDGHCATVLISNSNNGCILYCASEERFSRKKNDGGFPFLAITKGLECTGASISDISEIRFSTATLPEIGIAVGSNPRLLSRLLSKFGSLCPRQILASNILSKQYIKNLRSKHERYLLSDFKKLQVESPRTRFYKHHDCHAASTIPFLSKNDNTHDTLIFTLDGSGDANSGSISIFKNGSIQNISYMHTLDSLGELYSQITAALNMKPLEHEFKVMGLAPYAHKEKSEQVAGILEKYFLALRIDKTNNLPFIRTFTNKWGYSLRAKLKESLKSFRFDEIAGGMQLHTENIITEYIQAHAKRYNCKNLAFAGGVFMNIKLNQEIKKKLGESYTYTFVPSCGDESLVFGSWSLGITEGMELRSNIDLINQVSKAYNPYKTGLYLGTEYNESDIEDVLSKKLNELDSHKIKTQRYDDPEKKLAYLLSRDLICARFQGKMEWGARSLGNRSILANPQNIFNLRKLNKAVKCRDFWMPFAPALNIEYATDYLDISNECMMDYAFMQVGANTFSGSNDDIKCAIHQYDHTARPQIVCKDINFRYHNLIKEFELITNIGCILNTSFNMHGHPVVETPNQAINVFINSGLEVLQLENFILRKT